MRRISVVEHVSLDGVMQAPGGALRERDLVSAYLLVICPLLLGRGKRLFEPGAGQELRLVNSVPATTGAIVARYEVTR